MPVNFIATVAVEGTKAIPYYDTLKTWVPILALLICFKMYFSGSHNTWDRNMHGRVALVTGGTSGLGASVVQELASKGTQVILLVRSIHDGWVAEYIDDIRDSTDNPLIYAEECDLSDLLSVRKFATRWLDNMPPRRLDMIVCCAAVAQPPSAPRTNTANGIESQFQVSYLSHYHLLNLLLPSIRSQPPDRDVRVILTSCVASVMGNLDLNDLPAEQKVYPRWSPHRLLGNAKLALALFGYVLQRKCVEYERKDQAPCNVHVCVVDPGIMRSPSFKRWITLGSLKGLFLYLLVWPVWWFFLKASKEGAQSIFYALMAPEIQQTLDVSYISECRIRRAPLRSEFGDQKFQEDLVRATDKLIETAEKQAAMEQKRAEGMHSKSKKESNPRNKIRRN